MDAQVKAKWMAALRSGQYKQTRRNLKLRLSDGTTKHCCLGVLCDVVGPTIVNEIPSLERYAVCTFVDMEGRQSSAMLSSGVLNATQIHYDQAETLAHMNDEGKSFNKIADYIDKYM